MAKILENNIVLTISKVVKTTDTAEVLELPADFSESILEVITGLLGDGYVVEITAS